MDLPTVVGQQTLYYIEVSLSFTYFLSLPLLKSYRKLLSYGRMTLKPYLKTRTIIIVEIKPTRMLVFQSFPLRYRTDRVVNIRVAII